MSLIGKLATYRALGFSNVLRVGVYRLGLKTKMHPVLKIKPDVVEPPFFTKPILAAPSNVIARKSWTDTSIHFGKHEFPLVGPPDWHANPFNNNARADATKPWSEIGDFSAGVGDIKTVWEASRFDWLIAMAQRTVCEEGTDLERLNEWIADWLEKNRPYSGVNWKCGQEASIRVLHLSLAAFILGQVDRPSDGVLALVKVHLKRIAPTISYAIGQQNNHGTSEAAALFVGGLWLARNGHPEGDKWYKLGRKWLEDRAVTLIEEDGTFSQYSVNYHRVMLDTYNFVEVWRRHFEANSFSPALLSRISAAVSWLYQFVTPQTGDAPNFGANDGARILATTDTDYRDYRPSVQLGAALFLKKRAYLDSGSYDQSLNWLRVKIPDECLEAPANLSLDNGGMHVLRNDRAAAYLRYPRFRFRPSQADALHLDLWVDGRNIFRDAGTYSYNSSPEETAYFNGVAAHNTVQFDDHDQMPRLGRFLFGDWLRTHNLKRVSRIKNTVSAAAAYKDTWGSEHERFVHLSENELKCDDKLAGIAKTATLRWRLPPGNWVLAGNKVSDGEFEITIESDRGVTDILLTEAPESNYYLEKANVPVLEVKTDLPVNISTRVLF